MWKFTNVRAVAAPALLALALALATVSCGADESADPESPDAANAAGALGDAPVVVLTGSEICANLLPDAVGAALGAEVKDGTPSDDFTPQCAYDYINATGATSNLTVASMRESDVGAKAGDEAFNYVLDLNLGLAAGTDVDQETLDAGDRSVRLSGERLHLGILSAGGHLVTIIMSTGDASTTAFNALISAAADAFA